MKGMFNKALLSALVLSSVSGAYAWQMPNMATMKNTKEVAGRLAGQAGRFVVERSQSFFNLVKKHPYAFGISSLMAVCGYCGLVMYKKYAKKSVGAEYTIAPEEAIGCGVLSTFENGDKLVVTRTEGMVTFERIPTSNRFDGLEEKTI